MGCSNGCGETQSFIKIEGKIDDDAIDRIHKSLTELDTVEDAFISENGACIINHFIVEGIERDIVEAISSAGFTTGSDLKSY
jgi:hypothetical protein